MKSTGSGGRTMTTPAILTSLDPYRPWYLEDEEPLGGKVEVALHNGMLLIIANLIVFF